MRLERAAFDANDKSDLGLLIGLVLLGVALIVLYVTCLCIRYDINNVQETCKFDIRKCY